MTFSTLHRNHVQALCDAISDEWQTISELTKKAKVGRSAYVEIPRIAEREQWDSKSVQVYGNMRLAYRRRQCTTSNAS